MLIQLAQDKVDFYWVEIVADIILNGLASVDRISCSSVGPIRNYTSLPTNQVTLCIMDGRRLDVALPFENCCWHLNLYDVFEN